jgi:hypothetical protein
VLTISIWYPALLVNSPYNNKLFENLERDAARHKNKAGKDTKEKWSKAKPAPQRKQYTSNGSTRTKVREVTPSSLDSDGDFEELILFEIDLYRVNDVEWPYLLQSQKRAKMENLHKKSPVVPRNVIWSGCCKELIFTFCLDG